MLFYEMLYFHKEFVNHLEIIVKKYLNGESAMKIAKEYGISRKNIHIWVKKYEQDGFEGLKSNTGKTSKSHKNMGIHLNT